MILQTTVEGPMLYTAFFIFIGCLLLRIIIFSYSLFKNSVELTKRYKSSINLFLKACVPVHRLFIRRPVYTFTRYLFHIGLIAVPVWFAGQVMLWEESRFQLGYWSLGYAWSNRITLLVLSAILLFFLRRILFKKIRQTSTIHDFVLLLITTFPFLTGYMLANNTLDEFASRFGFLGTGDALRTIHIFSGELFILSMAFLFVKARVNPVRCLACAACAANCPTNALTGEDAAISSIRYLKYVHFQCICCGNCTHCCPEDAITLRHDIGPGHLFQIIRKHTLHSEALCECEKCGNGFIPHAQYMKVQNTVSTNLTRICPACRQRRTIDLIHH